MIRLPILLVCLLFLSFCKNQASDKDASAFDPVVRDMEELYSQKQKDSIRSLIKKYERQTSIEIGVITAMSFDPFEDIKDFAIKQLKVHRIGKGDKQNGIVIVLSKSGESVFIQTGKGLEEEISYEELKNLLNSKMVPLLKKGYYYKGVLTGIEGVMGILKKNENVKDNGV